MRGQIGVMNKNRAIELDAAGNMEQIFDFGRPALECGHEALRIGTHREQPVRQLSGLMDGLIDEADDAGCVRRFRKAFLGQFLFLNFAHESHAGKMLPQAVVEILPDAPLLAGADFEDRLLHMLAFGDVANRARNQHTLRGLQRAQADFHGKLVAVFVQTVKFFSGGAHGTHARRSEKILAMRAMPLPQARRAQHFLAPVAEQLFHLRVDDRDLAFAIDHDHSVRRGFQQSAKFCLGFLQFFFGPLQFGDVERGAGNEPRPAILAANHLGFAVKPDGAPIPRHHSICRAQRSAREKHLRRLDAPALLVVGMNLLIPADGIFQPLFLREAERGLNLRTDIRLADSTIQVGHENNRGNLFDQGTIDRIDVGQLLRFLIVLPVMRRQKASGVGSRLRAAEEYRGEIDEKSLRFLWAYGWEMIRFHGDALRSRFGTPDENHPFTSKSTRTACFGQTLVESSFAPLRRQLGSLFNEAWVNLRSAWIALPYVITALEDNNDPGG